MNEVRMQDKARFYTIFVLLATLFTYAVVMNLPAASVNELGRDFKVSNTILSSVFRLFMLGFLVAAIFGGRLSDIIGKMPVVAYGCAFMAGGMLIFSRASAFAILPIASVIAGLGGGMTEVVGMAVISDMYDGRRRTTMMNWSQVIFAAGAITGPLVLGYILKSGINWRQGFLVAAILCIVTSLATAFAARGAGERSKLNTDNHLRLRDIASNKMIVQLSIGLLLYVGAELGFVYWIAKYFEEGLHASPVRAASAVAVLWVGVGVGRWVATLLSERMSDIHIIQWSLGISALIAAFLLLATDSTSGLALTFCMGVPLGPVWPTIVSRAGHLFPQQSGSVIGIVASVGCLGAIIFPSVIGWMSDAIGIRQALWTSVAALAIALLIIMAQREQHEIG